MEPTTWTINLIHEIAMTIGAVAAVIAALSSLKNGRTLNGDVKTKVADVHAVIAKPLKRKTQSEESEDWFRPPDFDK